MLEIPHSRIPLTSLGGIKENRNQCPGFQDSEMYSLSSLLIRLFFKFFFLVHVCYEQIIFVSVSGHSRIQCMG